MVICTRIKRTKGPISCCATFDRFVVESPGDVFFLASAVLYIPWQRNAWGSFSVCWLWSLLVSVTKTAWSQLRHLHTLPEDENEISFSTRQLFDTPSLDLSKGACQRRGCVGMQGGGVSACHMMTTTTTITTTSTTDNSSVGQIAWLRFSNAENKHKIDSKWPLKKTNPTFNVVLRYGLAFCVWF